MASDNHGGQDSGPARELREHLPARPLPAPATTSRFPEDIGRPGDPNGAFLRQRALSPDVPVRPAAASPPGAARGLPGGHLSSTDLVHWRHHPDALLPDDYDGGIFSGGAFVDDDRHRLPHLLARQRVVRGHRRSASPAAATVTTSAGEKLMVPSLDGTEFGILKTSAAGGGDALPVQRRPQQHLEAGRHLLPAGRQPAVF